MLASWRIAMPNAGDIVMHVNVSGKDLSRGTLVPHVRAVLSRHCVPPHCLVLEITESTLMEQRDKALHALGELRDLGVGLGIDDFGTGYSSLAYLSTLPFDCLKIDRSFVVGMQRSAQNGESGRAVLSRGDGGAWTVELHLKPGRYHYSFLIDGRRWASDPAEPRVVESDFGAPMSVLTVS